MILFGGVLSGGIGIRFALYFLELQNLNQGAVYAWATFLLWLYPKITSIAFAIFTVI